MDWTDEIVEEVRRARDEYAARFNYDISAICSDIRQKQNEGGRKVVALKSGKPNLKKPTCRRRLKAIGDFSATGDLTLMPQSRQTEN